MALAFRSGSCFKEKKKFKRSDFPLDIGTTGTLNFNLSVHSFILNVFYEPHYMVIQLAP